MTTVTPFEQMQIDLGDYSNWHNLSADGKALSKYLTKLTNQRDFDIAIIGLCFYNVYDLLHVEFTIKDAIPGEADERIIMIVYKAVIRMNVIDVLIDGLPVHIQEWLAYRAQL